MNFLANPRFTIWPSTEKVYQALIYIFKCKNRWNFTTKRTNLFINLKMNDQQYFDLNRKDSVKE